MCAIVISGLGSPDVLEIVVVPDPVPGKDDVLIDVQAISLEGGDLLSPRISPPETQHPLGRVVLTP